MATKQSCPDCGEAMYGGACTWCHEEIYVAEQYEMDGESVPDNLYTTAQRQLEEIRRTQRGKATQATSQ